MPATTVIFFAKYDPSHYIISLLIGGILRSILPGIAFSLDLIETTAQYGVTEGLRHDIFIANA